MDKKKNSLADSRQVEEELIPEPIVEEVTPVIEEVPAEPETTLPQPVGIIDGADTR